MIYVCCIFKHTMVLCAIREPCRVYWRCIIKSLTIVTRGESLVQTEDLEQCANLEQCVTNRCFFCDIYTGNNKKPATTSCNSSLSQSYPTWNVLVTYLIDRPPATSEEVPSLSVTKHELLSAKNWIWTSRHEPVTSIWIVLSSCVRWCSPLVRHLGVFASSKFGGQKDIIILLLKLGLLEVPLLMPNPTHPLEPVDRRHCRRCLYTSVRHQCAEPCSLDSKS